MIICITFLISRYNRASCVNLLDISYINNMHISIQQSTQGTHVYKYNIL